MIQKISLLICLLPLALGFQNKLVVPSRSLLNSPSLVSLAAKTTDGTGEGGGGIGGEEEFSEEYAGSVDWDAEWKKVVANDGNVEGGGERPGKDFYKSEAEIAAIKAVNTASEKASEVGSNVGNAMPDIRSLSGDWKFWIAILAIVSVGLSVLSAPSNIPTNIPTGGSSDSYYI